MPSTGGEFSTIGTRNLPHVRVHSNDSSQHLPHRKIHSIPSTTGMRRSGRLDSFGRARVWKSLTFRGMEAKCWIPVIILLIGLVSLHHQLQQRPPIRTYQQKPEHKLWSTAPSLGWRPSCTQRSSEWLPPRKSNGYLVVRCNGGLNQQRSAIGNAVLAARIMNATLVLPTLDANSFWNDNSGFTGIYDVDHFITSLKNDVRVVRSLPAMWTNETRKIRLKPLRMQPPRDAPVDWYETIAVEKLKQNGALYLTPFAHRLVEELDNHEYQRLRCRVNYHALRFKNEVRNLSSMIVGRLRSEGPYMSIHLRFEQDMLAFAGCLDIFNPEEQKLLKNYRNANFAPKELEYSQRRLIGKCPLTPEEVGLFLRAMGFDNSTRIYIASGEIFGGERFLKPLQALFPRLETRVTVTFPEELGNVSTEGHGSLGSAVDYMVCLLSEIFVPTYDGPSNFANNLIGQRLYHGYRKTLQPDRKALAPLFLALEKGLIKKSDFETSVREVMSKKSPGGPHVRVLPESFFSNPWPECFCSNTSHETANHCPSKTDGFKTYDEDEDENFAYWNV